jgi:hypothetical protein
VKKEEDLKSLGRMESASNTCGIFRHTGNEVVVGSSDASKPARGLGGNAA